MKVGELVRLRYYDNQHLNGLFAGKKLLLISKVHGWEGMQTLIFYGYEQHKPFSATYFEVVSESR